MPTTFEYFTKSFRGDHQRSTFKEFDKSFRGDHHRILSFFPKFFAQACIKWFRECVASTLSRIRPRLVGGFVDRSNDAFRELLTQFKQAIKDHGAFEEKIFYPLLRKKLGAKAPIDEAEHAQVDELLTRLSENKTLSEQRKLLKELQKVMISHFHNEEKYLLPAAHEVITDHEFEEMKQEFEQMKHCHFVPLEGRLKDLSRLRADMPRMHRASMNILRTHSAAYDARSRNKA